jgi:hypothetical protein
VLRGLILLLFICGIGVVAAPFVVSSLYLDQRGIAISGRVYSKAETVRVHNSSWSRSPEVTVEYWPPDTGGVSFFGVTLDPERYDTLHVGQKAALRYLLRKDVPDLPLSRILREMHALPMVRLADQRAFANLSAPFQGAGKRVWQWAAGVVLLLVIWRVAGWPKFGWAVGVCCALALAAVLIQEFPRPTPRPVSGVRNATGHIQSIETIGRLFEGSRSRGLDTLQPVEVAAIEFVPEGRADAVVAVDLIDAGSIAGLKKGATVAIEYEAASPRTAYLQGATRNFARRNVNGVILQAGLYVGVLLAVWAVAQWIGGAFRRLVQRVASQRRG